MADFNDFGLLVGRYHANAQSLTDLELRELLLDSAGRLIISGRWLEDSAHASGDAGIGVLAVRNDADATLVDADGDYAPLQVNAKGRLKVDAELDVDFDYVYEEDSAFTSGDLGAYILAVRQDTLATDTSTDGDFASFKVNALGELYVTDTDAIAELVDVNAELNAITALLTTIDADTSNIDSNITALTKTEDTAHASGDKGIMPLAVRNDADTSLVNADGDYAPFQVDVDGNLKVIAITKPIGSEQYTVTDALAAAGDGVETITALATPWVTVASLSHTTGTAYLYGWQWACDQNADARIVTDDGSDLIVYKRALNSSALPTYQEQFSEGGRIEIAGATDLEIKLQIKKRTAIGGNASGTGSMHIRVK